MCFIRNAVSIAHAQTFVGFGHPQHILAEFLPTKVSNNDNCVIDSHRTMTIHAHDHEPKQLDLKAERHKLIDDPGFLGTAGNGWPGQVSRDAVNAVLPGLYLNNTGSVLISSHSPAMHTMVR